MSEPYQGPVRPTDKEKHFRKTGETKTSRVKKFIEGTKKAYNKYAPIVKKKSVAVAKEGYKAGVHGVAVTSSALESIDRIASKYGKVKLKNRQIVRSGPRAVVNINQEVAFEDKSRFFDQPQPTSILHSDTSSLNSGSMFSGRSDFFVDSWEKEKKRANILSWD